MAGISGLEELVLANTRLTTEQLSAIWSQLASSEQCGLTALDLSYNNFTSVPPEILAAISSLERLSLDSTSLTDIITTRSFRAGGLTLSGGSRYLSTPVGPTS